MSPSQAISPLEKPVLRRSLDHAYETLLEETSITSFDRENDPPLDVDQSFSSKSHDSFYQLSLDTNDGPLEVEDDGSTGNGANLEAELAVVKIASASDSSALPADICRPNLDETEDDGIVRPFSLQASPVKRIENTLCSLESIDADILNLTNAAQDSLADSKKWITFGTQRVSEEETDDAFSPNVFGDLDAADTDNAADTNNVEAVASVLRQLGELTVRLASLERIVHGMVGNTPTRVSDSNSDQSPSGDCDRDIAFVIEGTDMLRISAVNEDITCATDWGSNEQAKSGKFLMKRTLRSRLFGKKSKNKPSPAKI